MLKQVSSYIMYITTGICTPTCPTYSQQLDGRYMIMPPTSGGLRPACDVHSCRRIRVRSGGRKELQFPWPADKVRVTPRENTSSNYNLGSSYTYFHDAFNFPFKCV